MLVTFLCFFLSLPLVFPPHFLTVPLLTVPCFPDRVKWHPRFQIYNLNWKYTPAFVDGLSVLRDISFHLFLAIWIKSACSIYVWIAVALGRVPVTLMTFVEKQLQTGTKDLTWSCVHLSRLTRFRLLFYVSLFWCTLFSLHTVPPPFPECLSAFYSLNLLQASPTQSPYRTSANLDYSSELSPESTCQTVPICVVNWGQVFTHWLWYIFQ